MTQAVKSNSRWISADAMPLPLKTSLFLTEPLDEKHAALDFEALMSCRDRLRTELQWGDWPPPNFNLERNRDDLRCHHDEFLRGEAFAYTVLSPDSSRCLGCVYLERSAEIQGAQLAFWVIDEAIDMEAFLLKEVLKWVHQAWKIKRVLIPLRDANARGIALARRFELVPWNDVSNGPLSAHRCFLSESGEGGLPMPANDEPADG